MVTLAKDWMVKGDQVTCRTPSQQQDGAKKGKTVSARESSGRDRGDPGGGKWMDTGEDMGAGTLYSWNSMMNNC